MPRRVQLSRKKGWRKPEGCVVVARPGKWGNPYRIGETAPSGITIPDAESAVGFFRMMLGDPEMRTATGYPTDEEIRRDLSGKDLACWCGGKWCHADILLQIANGDNQDG